MSLQLPLAFTPCSEDLLKNIERPEDPQDSRLGSVVQRILPFEEESFFEKFQIDDFVILGYPDDRGVERNGGRTGAFAGPDHIRKQLYKMTASHKGLKKIRLWDLGNLKSWSMELASAHDYARELLKILRARGVRVITLGGGHDWAYADFVDFKPEGASPLPHKILNIDAHLDVRPNPEDPLRADHSGTPFRKILETRSEKSAEIAMLGLQEHCNAQHHLEWAQSRKVTTLFLNELPMNFEGGLSFIEERLMLKEKSMRLGLSLDLDVFAQSVAPGVSAPQAMGIHPELIAKLFEHVASRTRHLGVYECNPSLDKDDQTARLAAKLIHTYLFA